MFYTEHAISGQQLQICVGHELVFFMTHKNLVNYIKHWTYIHFNSLGWTAVFLHMHTAETCLRVANHTNLIHTYTSSMYKQLKARQSG